MEELRVGEDGAALLRTPAVHPELASLAEAAIQRTTWAVQGAPLARLGVGLVAQSSLLEHCRSFELQTAANSFERFEMSIAMIVRAIECSARRVVDASCMRSMR